MKTRRCFALLLLALMLVLTGCAANAAEEEKEPLVIPPGRIGARGAGSMTRDAHARRRGNRRVGLRFHGQHHALSG